MKITTIKELLLPANCVRLGYALLVIGMVSSPLLMSLGVGVLFLSAMRTPVRTWKSFYQDRVLMSVSLILLLFLASGFFTADLERWADRVRTKIPFLLLPVAFAAIPPIDRRELRRMIGFFVGVVGVVCLGILVYYVFNYEEVTAKYLMGQPIPTPLNHIRFSLLVAYSWGCALWLLRECVRSGQGGFAIASGIAGIILLAFLHILAVRSGLLAAYLIALYALGFLIVRSQRFALGGIIAGLMIVAGIVAFSTVPTLKNRIAYARYDLQKFFEGEVNPDLSDAQRLGSIHAGIMVGKQSPLIGVGIGDVQLRMRQVYEEHYPDLADKNTLPHNQWVFIFAGMGLAGVFVFGWSVLAPWFVRGVWNEPLFVSHMLVVFPSFMTENTIENQLGVALYLTFLLLSLNAAAGRSLGFK